MRPLSIGIIKQFDKLKFEEALKRELTKHSVE